MDQYSKTLCFKHKAIYSVTPFLEHSGKCRTTVVKIRSVTAEVQKAGCEGDNCKGASGKFWANGNILYLDCTGDLPYVFVKPH